MGRPDYHHSSPRILPHPARVIAVDRSSKQPNAERWRNANAPHAANQQTIGCSLDMYIVVHLPSCSFAAGQDTTKQPDPTSAASWKPNVRHRQLGVAACRGGLCSGCRIQHVEGACPRVPQCEHTLWETNLCAASRSLRARIARGPSPRHGVDVFGTTASPCIGPAGSLFGTAPPSPWRAHSPLSGCSPGVRSGGGGGGLVRRIAEMHVLRSERM
jgi:hypothetical protein